MDEKETQDLEIEPVETVELEDEDLEDVSGGDNKNCSCSIT